MSVVCHETRGFSGGKKEIAVEFVSAYRRLTAHGMYPSPDGRRDDHEEAASDTVRSFVRPMLNERMPEEGATHRLTLLP